jgi:hypothetical protein
MTNVAILQIENEKLKEKIKYEQMMNACLESSLRHAIEQLQEVKEMLKKIVGHANKYGQQCSLKRVYGSDDFTMLIDDAEKMIRGVK